MRERERGEEGIERGRDINRRERERERERERMRERERGEGRDLTR